MSLRGWDWLSAVSEKGVSDFRSWWSVQHPITPPPHTVLNHLTLLLLRVPGFAGGSDYGAAAGHASGGAGVAEDGAQDAADDRAFGGVAAGADFVGWRGSCEGLAGTGLRQSLACPPPRAWTRCRRW